MSDDANVWAPVNTVPLVTAASSVVPELFVAEAGQLVFDLNDFSYVPHSGSIIVYKNGTVLIPGVDFIEVNSTRFQLAVSSTVGDKILALGFIGVIGGSTNVNYYGLASINSVYELITADKTRPTLVASFYENGTVLQGIYYWSSATNKNTANGGTIIDPDKPGTLSATSLGTFLAVQGTGTGTGCWVLKYTELAVEIFGAVGGLLTDSMASFQQTANYAKVIGAKRIACLSSQYYLSSYSISEVSDILGVSYTGTSKMVVLPSGCTFEGDSSLTELVINGGSSSPLGYSTSLNFGSFPLEGQLEVAVSSVNVADNSVVVASITDLVVGQLVQLARFGGLTGSIPNTPSQEVAPQQMLTIKSIVNTTVTFKESFFQHFESVADLHLYRSGTTGEDFHKDIYIKNIKFSSGATAPYILFSRVFGFGFLGTVKFSGGSHFSFGSSQRAKIENLIIEGNGTASTCESTNEVDIQEIYADGQGSNNSLGGMYFSDNVRKLTIGKMTANNYTKTGFSLLYGIDAVINEVELNNCGADSIYNDGYTAGLSLGFPAAGAHANLETSEADAYKVKNNGTSTVIINKFKSTGPSNLPLRFHDVDLTIEHGYIEYTGTTGYPYATGKSGDRRSDATYFSSGGETKVKFGSLETVTLSGTPNEPWYKNGYNSVFYDYQTTVPGGAAVSATTVTVTDGSKFQSSDILYYVDESGTGVTAIAVDITGVSGNDLTTDPLVKEITSGQGVWNFTALNSVISNVTIDRLIVDGVVTNPTEGHNILWPDTTTGAGPYTGTIDLPVPSEGNWELHLQVISKDLAQYATGKYSVNYSTLNAGFHIEAVAEITKTQVRTNVDILSVPTITSGDVTVTIESSVSGQNTILFYKWVPVMSIIDFI